MFALPVLLITIACLFVLAMYYISFWEKSIPYCEYCDFSHFTHTARNLKGDSQNLIQKRAVNRSRKNKQNRKTNIVLVEFNTII